MAIENFRQLAAYNHWANMRIYGAAHEMPEQQYRRATGVFFGSLHGTLNHLLLTDRIWLRRLTGTGEHPDRLDAILFDDRRALLRARIAEDARLSDFVTGQSEADLTQPVEYRTTSGKPKPSDPPSRPCPCLLLDRDRQRTAVARPAGVSARRARTRSRLGTLGQRLRLQRHHRTELDAVQKDRGCDAEMAAAKHF